VPGVEHDFIVLAVEHDSIVLELGTLETCPT